MEIKAVWVDPADGWKYGFPRIYNKEVDGPINEWLLKWGYPEHLLEFPARMWEAVRNEEEND